MASGATEILVHGTAIALGERAALIRGAAGSGKSDLALRTIGCTLEGVLTDPISLVADDQVVIRTAGEALIVSPPPVLAGLIEVRGLGILKLPYRAEARLSLVVDLVGPGQVERMPDPWPVECLLGVELPVLRLAPFEASAGLKLAVALAREPWGA